jgi:hypothetical protein
MSSIYNISMNSSEIIKLYKSIIKEITGSWLLTGGALLNVLGFSDRETLDIDMVPLDDIRNKDQLMIMDIAAGCGLPPETINFAAEYYVKKQNNWKNEIIVIFKNDKCCIYRPTKKLFRALKEARGTETDLADIEIYEKCLHDKEA